MRGVFKTETKAGESVIRAEMDAETATDVLMLTAIMKSANVRRRREAIDASEFLAKVFRNRAERLKRASGKTAKRKPAAKRSKGAA